jgi:hypothetical protein
MFTPYQRISFLVHELTYNYNYYYIIYKSPRLSGNLKIYVEQKLIINEDLRDSFFFKFATKLNVEFNRLT